MNYFISRNDQEYGPYTLADMQRYVASGEILVTDKARSAGMDEWTSVSQVIGTIPVPLVPRVRSSEPGLRREGNKLVVTRGAALPLYCVKCAQPGSFVLEKNFVWSNPLLALFLILGLIGIIIYLPVYYSTRKQMKLSVPLCEEHRRARRTELWIGAILMLASPLVWVVVVTVDRYDFTLAGSIVFAAMMLAGAVVLIMASPLRARKVDDFQGWFAGAREPFLQVIESQDQLS